MVLPPTPASVTQLGQHSFVSFLGHHSDEAMSLDLFTVAPVSKESERGSVLARMPSQWLYF